MIRIDEIYQNVFWPFVKQHIPKTRIFYCDPPGRSDPDSLFCQGVNGDESNYIFFHDQEPIHLDVHAPLFNEVMVRNLDLNNNHGPRHRAVVTSEFDSDFVSQVRKRYGWNEYYYFFHGWAALDWYRGYNHSFLIKPIDQRKITHSFINPNRIVGGKREHRLQLMYHLLLGGVENAHISFPRVCPAENIEVTDLAQNMLDLYPDIVEKFQHANLPMNFQGEVDHPMTSCWLDLFEQSSESLAYVVTETVYRGNRKHLTEKTFKPICLKMPFVLTSTAGSLEYLRSYGFKTFGTVWDESYDLETDDDLRINKIADLLLEFDRMTPQQLQIMHNQCRHIVEHNYQHFYSGAFEQLLWHEFDIMIKTMKRDFQE